ncbi:MAG: type I-F CRISPR-associated endoribonuclease Cas6/Csy4 [Halobacteriovoraceae bacterium]|nr:type I-F CRISPR-associated endoribonuclease Cas6/Csy4 [Halobacteriovoraceae bacterium]
MSFYLEITLLPGIDVNLFHLWEKVYSQTHLAMAKQLNSNGHSKIGVSFPEYSSEEKRLGKILRLLAEKKEHLEHLAINKWLNRLQEYVHITSIRPIPTKRISGYILFRRERSKSNIERIIRRKAKREGISEENAKEKLGDFKEKFSNSPYINIKSLSTGKKFKLFILKKNIDSMSKGNRTFGSYGLGITDSSFVPEF